MKTCSEIFFGDAAHMRSDHHSGRTWGKKGKTPVVETTGARHGMSLISAITSRGHMRFMIKEKGGLFPGTKVDPAKNTETEVMTTKRGFRLSTSVGGTLTGRGGNLIIVNDPIKPADAMSDTTRERLIQWCGTTL